MGCNVLRKSLESPLCRGVSRSNAQQKHGIELVLHDLQIAAHEGVGEAQRPARPGFMIAPRRWAPTASVAAGSTNRVQAKDRSAKAAQSSLRPISSTKQPLRGG